MSVKPLSGNDIKQKMNNDCVILPYEKLSEYKDINKLFWLSKNVFLLYPISENFGHWVLLLKRDSNIIECFDSYGIYPDMEYKHGAKKTPKYLSDLLIKSRPDIKLYYNEKQFQKWNTNYCGYYCIYRAVNSNTKLKNIQKILENQVNPDNYVYEKIITM